MLNQNEIDALLEERRGYIMRGLKDRIAQVDEQLRIRGYSATGSDAAPVVESADMQPAEKAVAAKPRKRS